MSDPVYYPGRCNAQEHTMERTTFINAGEMDEGLACCPFKDSLPIALSERTVVKLEKGDLFEENLNANDLAFTAIFDDETLAREPHLMHCFHSWQLVSDTALKIEITDWIQNNPQLAQKYLPSKTIIDYTLRNHFCQALKRSLSQKDRFESVLGALRLVENRFRMQNNSDESERLIEIVAQLRSLNESRIKFIQGNKPKEIIDAITLRLNDLIDIQANYLREIAGIL